ncbi:hypothetical protein [Corynebacterium stationis]|uniref:hypothetical protein n=1 Tax=Corynebacterium stationis TaxID=1705 RepID=UPI000A415406|nr:hypothetical protein [Corynebacterium stationis]HJG65207.1 hypothetical protein [Corynebacterium stationis]
MNREILTETETKLNGENIDKRSEIIQGIRASLAAGLGMISLGVAFGVLVVQSGLPW